MTSRRDIKRRLDALEAETESDRTEVTIRHVSVDEDGEPTGVTEEFRSWEDGAGRWHSESETYDPPASLEEFDIDG